MLVLAAITPGGGVAELSRQRTRRPSRPARRRVRNTGADRADPIWIEVCGRRMFVVGWTSDGAPYGVFEDETEAGVTDPDPGECDWPH
jgi:hypothetical protein